MRYTQINSEFCLGCDMSIIIIYFVLTQRDVEGSKQVVVS